MSFVMYAGLAFYSLTTLSAFAYTFLKGRSFALVPSLGWLSFMALPFLVLWAYFPEPYRMIHAQGCLIVGTLLLLADLGAFFYLHKRIGQDTHATMTPAFLNFVAWGASALLIAIAAYHLMAAESIPLIDRLFGNGDAGEYLAERNKFQRDLPVPFFLRYLINFNVYIFGSLALVLHWLYGRRRVAITIAVAIVIYSVLSTAKLPAMMAVVIITGLFAMHLCERYDWLRKTFFGTYILGMALVGLFYVLAAPKIITYYAHAPFESASPDDPRRVTSIGDFIRSPEADVVSKQRAFVYRKVEYLVYRIFLTPVEVSDRWYQYFSYAQKTPEPLSSLLGRAAGSDTPHPSVRVGHWAYHEKFPSKYMPDVHAYGSLDADAFAYGGLKAVLIAGLIFGLVRFAFAVFHTPNPIAETLHITALILMMAIPASGSLPALLAPHGLAALLLIMMGVWIWTGLHNRRRVSP
ncbi:MAG: hypothetical protein EBQ96_00605 [Proteobacteria bacterium]|nr:hypothetical protein [Pseudomonadota bacterium]